MRELIQEYWDPVGNFFSENQFCIPLEQVMALVMLTSICLLLRKDRLGLMVSYSFVLYWGFIFNREHLIDILSNSSTGLVFYSLLGVGMAGLAVFGFIQDTKYSRFVVGKITQAGNTD